MTAGEISYQGGIGIDAGSLAVSSERFCNYNFKEPGKTPWRMRIDGAADEVEYRPSSAVIEMSNHGRLAGKHILVTGGLSGIGRAIVAAMAAEGANVTIMDKASAAREDGLAAEKLCAQIGPNVAWRQGDVASEHDVEAVFADILPIDVLVNNAGVTTFKPLENSTVDDFDRLIAVNVKGVFLMTRSAVKSWIRAARTGAVVNVASNLAFVGAPSASIYCASKGAVATFTKAVAAEVGPLGIRVNMLCPGPVETEFNRDHRKRGAQQEWEQATPLRNRSLSILADPARIAPAAVFLASDEARHITGASLLVDGGMNSI